MGKSGNPADRDHDLVEVRLQLPRWLGRRLRVLAEEKDSTPSRLAASLLAPLLSGVTVTSPAPGVWVPEPDSSSAS